MGDIFRNEQAMLATLRYSEGTAGHGDPYRICMGYQHVIVSLKDHPAITGEWAGQRLPDTMCMKAGLGPGCVSTAAGAYQLIKPTWRGIRDRLRLPDFEGPSQDRAALYLIANCGALEDVHAGRMRTAIAKCAREWASLPGNIADQPQLQMNALLTAFTDAGGTLA